MKSLRGVKTCLRNEFACSNTKKVGGGGGGWKKFSRSGWPRSLHGKNTNVVVISLIVNNHDVGRGFDPFNLNLQGTRIIYFLPRHSPSTNYGIYAYYISATFLYFINFSRCYV
jgi:hypothetical protein